MEAPRCKICHECHWLSEPHEFVTRVTPVTLPVTKSTNVTRPVTRVTTGVTEAMMIEAAVTEQHECPICGLLHHRPVAHAERQRAYRERKAT